MTLLLLLYLQLSLLCTKIDRLNEYMPEKCLNGFVQSGVVAGRHGEENSNSNIVAETMKLLANSSNSYQFLDSSRHTVTKYLSDKKTRATFNSKLFKKLDHVNRALYEVKLVKTQIEHREPIIVWFFILQYANFEYCNCAAAFSPNSVT